MRLIHKGCVTPAHLVHMDMNTATVRLKNGEILTDIDADLVQLMWGMTTDAEVRVCVCVCGRCACPASMYMSSYTLSELHLCSDANAKTCIQPGTGLRIVSAHICQCML